LVIKKEYDKTHPNQNLKNVLAGVVECQKGAKKIRNEGQVLYIKSLISRRGIQKRGVTPKEMQNLPQTENREKKKKKVCALTASRRKKRQKQGPKQNFPERTPPREAKKKKSNKN